jgi:hypothetical protein
MIMSFIGYTERVPRARRKGEGEQMAFLRDTLIAIIAGVAGPVIITSFGPTRRWIAARPWAVAAVTSVFTTSILAGVFYFQMGSRITFDEASFCIKNPGTIFGACLESDGNIVVYDFTRPPLPGGAPPSPRHLVMWDLKPHSK